MNIVVGSRRLGRLAMALALLVSNCTQVVLLTGANRSTVALAAQKQSASDQIDRRAAIDDKNFTRARRAEAPLNAVQPSSPAAGPLIRVGLMTDVSSVMLGSSSGLIVRTVATKRNETPTTSVPSLTVELRRLSEPAAQEPKASTTYRVEVGDSTDLREARKLVEELKKKFFEPVLLTVDEKRKEHSVLIGQFKSRGEAARFLDRLRSSGYESLHIVSDPNARAENEKPQPISISHSGLKPGGNPLKLVALAADKVAAASEHELVISPVIPQQPDRGREASPSGTDRNRNQTESRDQDAAGEHGNRIGAPAVVRIGKTEYRGEISLVLNPRGRINVVNVLPLEDYLRGVVPMELSPGAYPEIEALKAQAVAARSYALSRLGRHLAEGYDLVDDTRDQVYGGLSAERELTNRAIEETRGLSAVFPNDEGKLVPIEALYTANCGGRTENNDEIFGGKPVPYLRAVACSADPQSFSARELVSDRNPERIIGVDGRSLAREVAVLSVLGFSFPRHLSSGYLSRPPDPEELQSWILQTAKLTQKAKPGFTRTDGSRLAEFARLVAIAVYGEGRASTLLSPADIDYLLDGLRVQALPRQARADIAMLLRDGILRVPAESALDGAALITRKQSIETLSRAISIRQPMSVNAQAIPSKSQVSNVQFQTPDLKSEVTMPAENGRLMIAASGSTRESLGRERPSRFTSVNTSALGRLADPQKDEPAKVKPAGVGKAEIAGSVSVPRAVPQRDGQRTGLEISEGAWLFRSLGGESHQVARLTLIGGERVVYHLNARGQVDFLEASISEHSASSDRFSSVAQWQERIPIDEIQQRLARARISVGRVEKIEPVAFSSSSRVTEIELTGDQSQARLRRSQIRAALGLREYLFVVDRELDARGSVVAFVFTGRGWGHGVGMCQTGAYGLAKEGYSYTAILLKYYTGVKLHKMY
jgi:peptidoglycan hydrolase-like amidase